MRLPWPEILVRLHRAETLGCHCWETLAQRIIPSSPNSSHLKQRSQLAHILAKPTGGLASGIAGSRNSLSYGFALTPSASRCTSFIVPAW